MARENKTKRMMVEWKKVSDWDFGPVVIHDNDKNFQALMENLFNDTGSGRILVGDVLRRLEGLPGEFGNPDALAISIIACGKYLESRRST